MVFELHGEEAAGNRVHCDPAVYHCATMLNSIYLNATISI
jgi:hypothetical protein